MNDYVTILLATYNPTVTWLVKLLRSINNQDYQYIHLCVIDDCSTNISLTDIDGCLKAQITNFKYTLSQNTCNIGSTKTFEKLTKMANDPYIAYCDQDDIWESFKLTHSIKLIKQTHTALVCSDVKIINSDDEITVGSITEIRKRHFFPTTHHVTNQLLFRNFVMGCTILMKTDIAQMAIPFIDDMVHDHWLALFTSTKSGIAVSDIPLIRYRIHDKNQTNVLTDVYTKEDYFRRRIITFQHRLQLLSQRIWVDEYALTSAVKWAQARVDYYRGNWQAIGAIWKYRELNRSTSYFEILMKFMPNFVFKWVLARIKSCRI